MPTIITHAVVAMALATKARGIQAAHRWRLFLACAACAILPDLDVIGFQFGVQYNSLFGHRGFTHSFFFAALLALPLAWLLHRKTRGGGLAFLRLFALLFGVTASHGLLDALTDGGEGVAFFSPFSNHRYFFPYRPVMVSPIGVGAFFGLRGLLVLINELLLIILPLAIVLFLPELWKKARSRKIVALLLVAAWAGALAVFNGLYPVSNISMTLSRSEHPVIDLYVKKYNNQNLLSYIPTYEIPGGKLVTDFLEFRRRGLFNRRLESANVNEHWAAGFFPNWFGGIAGRWQDPNPSLFLRTLFGYGVPDSREIQEVLKNSARSEAKRDYLFRLSPTEKYDLALGDYKFASTRSILAVTHNSPELPKFWYGICNGLAAAAKWYKEPFRAVEVINPNGFRIRFHPNDVKALLGYAQANSAHWTEIGTRCNVNGPEAESCRVNPGAFFLATMNRIALAKDSFIVDGFSGTRKQFYLFDAVRVEVLSGPTPATELKELVLPTPVKSVAKVRFTMDFVSTLLGDKESGHAEEAAGNGFYKKVGRIVVPRVLEALIALNEANEVIGGAWLGNEDVPDVIFFSGPLPAVDKFDRLTINTNLNWEVIRKIYERSVNEEPNPAPLDFSL